MLPRIPRRLRFTRLRLTGLACACLLLVAACSEPAPTTGPGATADGGLPGFDGAIGFDVPGIPDTGGDAPGASDGGPVFEVFEPDVAEEGGFLWPCADNGVCASGLCVETAEGKVCTKTCADSCPAGWSCGAVPGPAGDVLSVCVPRFARLCDPCATAADCNLFGSGNLCQVQGPLGGFCTAACDPGQADACPAGYGCQALQDPGTGKATHQCVRSDGACPCSPTASQKQLQTACTLSNAAGTCKGVRSCAGGTLSDCSAAVPAAETCNGADDDCDGQTDDVEPAACENKNAHGTCTGQITGCASGAAVCSAAEPKAEACNLADDDCDGQTDEGLCEDGLVCTVGVCNSDGSCQQQPAPGGTTCDDGNVCTVKDVCAAGQCQGTAPLDCDDQNGCTADSCDAVTGCVHAPADGPCADDGNPCTLDQCQTGKCAHPAVATGTSCPDDGKPCTQDVCQGDKCAHPPAAKDAPCPDDGDACTVDACDGLGACGHPVQPGSCSIGGKCVPAGTKDPGHPCKVCDPAVSQTAYVVKEAMACDDGNACTLGDACSGGLCKGAAKDCSGLDDACNQGICNAKTGTCAALPKAGLCDDGNACTSGDQCAGGKCAGVAVNCSGLDDACNTGTCAGGACVKKPKASTVACSDGDPCTSGDHCSNGSCTATPIDCSGAGDGCNDGVCAGGGCVQKPKAQGTPCTDGNACTLNDACNFGTCQGAAKDCSGSGDPCNDGVCSGGGCTKKPKATGVSCNDGDSCTTADKCAAGQCLGSAIDCSGLNDACHTGFCAGGVCNQQTKANGTTCSDGNACTTGDTCQSGTCAGKAKDCSGLDDACNTGVCSGGTCSKKAKSNGTLCNDGSACTTADKCTNGTCAGSSTADINEPNGSSGAAKKLTDKTDCDDASSLTATISPTGDVDWYTYQANDKAFCTIKPNATLKGMAADYDLCVYFKCGNGKTGTGTVSCANGSKVSGGPSGSYGCCSSNTGTTSELAKVSPSCTFAGTGSEAGQVWLRVQGKTAGATCGGYTLEWSAKN